MASKEPWLPRPAHSKDGQPPPPGCVSTRCSRGGEISISTTFADHREADACIPHLTACAKTPRPLGCSALEYSPRSTAPSRYQGGHMRAQTVQPWIARHILVRRRLAHVCTSYLFFLMVATRKHALEEAARFSGLHKSQCSKMLKAHSNVAVSTLESLSKKQAKQVAKARQKLKELPWDIALIVDSTLQHRASLHPENAKTFNHGQGFGVGHQWTNIVLLLHDMLRPLRPIPSYSQRYCRDHKLEYRTEHDLVIDYLQQLQREEYIGSYDPRAVVVLTDSGYDKKRIQKAIAAKPGHFIIALG